MRPTWQTAGVFFSLAFIISGCAISHVNYLPPEPTKQTAATITVKKSADDIWQSAISTLGSNFFVINNLEKDSGFINVSYSADPEKYCDCGVYNTDYSFQLTEKLTFQGAKSRQDYWTVIPWPDRRCVKNRRTMALDGRINILIKDRSASECDILVNSRYQVTESIQSRIADNTLYRSDSETIVFDSGNAGEFSSGTVCRPNGRLEKELLELLSGL